MEDLDNASEDLDTGAMSDDDFTVDVEKLQGKSTQQK
jgi:hypothetical protein